MKPIRIATLIFLLSMNCSIGLSAPEQNSATGLKGSASWERVGKIQVNEKITVRRVKRYSW